MTKKERVYYDIEFNNPDKIPIWAFNRDQTKGDIISYELLFPVHGGNIEKSEWGYTWENLGDGTIGQPKKIVILNCSMLDSYDFPDPDSISRLQDIGEFKSNSKKHFLVAEMGISGFNTYMFLRGFINVLIDFKLNEIRVMNLLDKFLSMKIQKAGFSYYHFKKKQC